MSTTTGAVAFGKGTPCPGPERSCNPATARPHMRPRFTPPDQVQIRNGVPERGASVRRGGMSENRAAVLPQASLGVALVPELEVSDFPGSLRFYVEVLGFSVLYDRPERPLAFLALGAAHVMIEHGGSWMTGPLERPFGPGMNLQIAVPDLAAVEARLAAAGWPLFRAAAEAWYRRGEEYVGARELVVQDTDGYLLRFAEDLGVRGAPP